MASILDDSYIPVALLERYPSLTSSPYIADASRFQGLKSKLSTMSPVTVLNELSQRLHIARPKYTFYNTKDGLYLGAVEVDGRLFRSTIPRYRKEESKKDAAKLALDAFWKHPDMFSRNEPAYVDSVVRKSRSEGSAE